MYNYITEIKIIKVNTNKLKISKVNCLNENHLNNSIDILMYSYIVFNGKIL